MTKNKVEWIRVSEPLLQGNEKKYLNQAIDEGEVSSGGKFVRRFEEAFARWSDNDYAVAVSSGSAALETALQACAYPKAEISIPNGTIISCLNAAIRAGYKFHLHDNDSQAKCIGIMACHLFGRQDSTVGLPIVDDLSQYWKPMRVEISGVYSLYANKLITSGEGGVVVTNDPNVCRRAKEFRNLCHTKTRFVHDDMGWNYRMSNLQAAVALAQLEQIENFTEIKQINRDHYLKHLPIGVAGLVPLFNVEVPWMYLVESRADAGEVVDELMDLGIEARRFFYPINKQPFVCISGDYPISQHLWDHAFYLPSGLTLTEKEIIRVSKTLRKILRSF